ncbi:hypothetical protein ACQCSV_15235 [Pseudarthrobacter sp. S3]|uniref:hypothetical protein n=1 Tax=Pseudarthrobacter sp. S3 TaxID=3418419 RepID=UPI003CF9C15F
MATAEVESPVPHGSGGGGEATVKTHLLRVFNKLDVDARTRAVVLAMERGVL